MAEPFEGSVVRFQFRSYNTGEFPDVHDWYGQVLHGERGYGFIKPDDGGSDVFVHITAVERAGLKDLAAGQRITFDVEPDKKGKGQKAVKLVISS
jgi:CspA family cold shock protein